MARIFISYKHADLQLVTDLARYLEKYGHEISIDSTGIEPGLSWREHLEEVIRNTDVFISLISPESEKSASAMADLGAAFGYAQESGRMLVLPVVIKNTNIPYAFDISKHRVITDRDADVEKIARRVNQAIAEHIGNRAAVQQKEAETSRLIEENASQYVGEAIAAQEKAERRYRVIGIFWYLLGLLALIAGLVFLGISLSRATGGVPPDWINFAYFTLRALVIVALLGACAKYAFSLGRSFTIEALKCADRLHAISFGKFYLRVYGHRANWDEVKEAFANWNIDRPSAFVDTKVADFDPKLVEMVTSIVQGAMSQKKP